jgi:lysophospholipase L1-like esterase
LRRISLKLSPLRSWRGILFTVYALATGVALAEGVARATYRAPWYERLLEEQQRNLGVDYEAVPGSAIRLRKERNRAIDYGTNAAGLRDHHDLATPKRSFDRRILVLGDSFAFGVGVRDEAAVFPRRLERLLNEQPVPGTERIEVLNGGLPGSLTKQWVDLTHTVGDRFQPDLVLAVFSLRDGTMTTSMGSFFEPVRDEIVARNQGSPLYRISYLYRALRDQGDRRLVADRYTAEMNKAYFGNADQTAEWERAQQNLVSIAQFAAARSAAFGLVIFPILVELDGGYPFEPICARIEAFAVSRGMAVLSLLPAFRGKSAADLWVSSYDQHPNEKAQEIAAHAIFPFARKLLLSAGGNDRRRPPG